MISQRPRLPASAAAKRNAARQDVGSTAPAYNSDWQAEVENPARRFAFFCGLAFIFIRFSMIHEMIAATTGVNTYLLYLVGPPALVGFLLAGGWPRTFRQRPALYWLGFVVSMIVAVPFSSWVGGSVSFVTMYLKTEILGLFFIAGLAITWKEVVALVNTLAAAAILNLAFARYLSGGLQSGRLALDIGSSISNSNDYAAHLIVLMPFLLAFALYRKRAFAVRLLIFTALMYSTVVILSTASRGALISLCVIAAALMIRANATQRVLGAGVLAISAFAILLFLPQTTRSRLLNFSTAETSSSDDEAALSASSRRYLMEQSLRFIATHPLFGVGPGQFSSYEGQISQQQGRRGYWHEAHNSFLQVASECGLPAFGFYLAAIVSSYRLLGRVYRRARSFGQQAADIGTIAFCTRIAMLGFCTAIFFLNFYHKFYLPAISGLAIALVCAAEREFARMVPSKTWTR